VLRGRLAANFLEVFRGIRDKLLSLTFWRDIGHMLPQIRFYDFNGLIFSGTMLAR
jgi:hypothetical protein